MTPRIRFAIFSFASLTLAALSVSCGGSQTGADAKSGGEGDGTSAADKRAAEPKLTPAPAPPGVVVRFRVKNPGQLADGFFEAASLPLDWRTLLNTSQEGRGLLEVVDVHGSVEAAVAMNERRPERPLVMGSIGVKSVDAVLKYLDREGMIAEEGPGGVHYFALEGEPCAVGRAIKGSPARVVCSDSRSGLSDFIPYALRGLPGEELSDAAVYLGVDIKPVKERYGKELKRLRLLASVGARQLHVGHAKYDRALTDAAIGLADELGNFLTDADSFSASLYEEEGSFRGLLSARFTSRSSVVAATIDQLASTQGEAPVLFDALPSTASAASYSRESSAALSSGWSSITADLLSGRAEYEGASKSFSDKLSAIVHALAPAGHQNVMGQGPLIVVQENGKSSLKPAWVAYGTTREKAEIVGLFDDLSSVLASKDLATMFPEMESRPKLTRTRDSIKGAPGAVVYQWSWPELQKLWSSDLEAAELALGAREKTAAALMDLSKGYLAVAEVNGQTWLSWGQSPRELSESYGALLSKDGEKLSQRGKLYGVRSEPAVTAGYLSVEALVGSFSFLLPSKTADSFSDLKRAAPSGGTVPATHFLKVESGDALRATWEVRVPREFTQDVATLGALFAADLAAEFKNP